MEDDDDGNTIQSAKIQSPTNDVLPQQNPSMLEIMSLLTSQIDQIRSSLFQEKVC